LSDADVRLPPWRRALLESGVVGLVSLGLALVVYRVWDAALQWPFVDRGDGRFISAMVQTVRETGWWTANPRLGAPYGQHLYDFPHGGEQLQLLVIKLLGYVTGSYGMTMNVYYLGGFFVLAVVSFLVFRRLWFSLPVASLLAIAFTFLPYHFHHSEGHLYRSTYYSVPLAAVLLLWSAAPDDTVLRHDGRRYVVIALVFCAVIGTTETMATAFTMVLLALSGIVLAIRRRRVAHLAVAGGAIGAIAITFFVSMFPTLLWFHDHGTNDVAAQRDTFEQEMYGLRPAYLVLPADGHRIEALSDFVADPQKDSPIPGEPGQWLGTLGAIGLVGALYLAVAHGVPRVPSTRPVRDHSGLFVVLAILAGTVSGFALILTLIGFEQVRVWNRISVFIAFFSLAVLGLGLERLHRWLRGRVAWGGVAVWAVTVALIAFTVWDTSYATPSSAEYRRIEARSEIQQRFVGDIERTMPAGASIFQFPVIPFPEYPPQYGMLDYEQFVGYLMSDDLRWSYGSVKGRPEADWQLKVRSLPFADAVAPLAGMGFTGIWVDRAGYPDKGRALEADIARVLDVQPMVSSDQRRTFWDMRPWLQRDQRTEAQLADEARRVFNIRPPA
jgi:phosphoglycerol transferase